MQGLGALSLLGNRKVVVPAFFTDTLRSPSRGGAFLQEVSVLFGGGWESRGERTWIQIQLSPRVLWLCREGLGAQEEGPDSSQVGA